MSPEAIESLLVEYGWRRETNTCLIITRAERPAAFSPLTSIVWRDDVRSVSELDQLERHSLALVFVEPEHLEKNAAVNLLAQLRDRYAERVLVCDEQGVFTSAELLALGYIRQRRPRENVRLYLHDPEEFFERREWNNPRDWANPENFDKFRW